MSVFPVYSAIGKRRSVRQFSDRAIQPAQVRKILEAGRWAPSGLNNQPWRFAVVQSRHVKDRIARCTEYSATVKRSDCIILVFLDKKNSYHLIKDVQAIGACIQNMLLCAFEMGIGTCWLGEILNQKKKVNALLNIVTRYELMAGIALGYPQKKTKSKRITLKHLLIKNI